MSFLKRIQPWHLLLIAVLLYLPLTFLGFGSDVDSYRVLTAGRNFMETADYVPSRRPVFIVHEMMTFLLDSIGGSLLSNLGTLAMSILTLYCFYKIGNYYQIPNIPLLMTLLILQPVYWVNSTCTMDYVWSIGFLMAGFWMMTEEKHGIAGIAFGLSMSTRLSSIIQVAGILLLFFWTHKQSRKQIVLSALLSAVLLSFALYLPWDFTEWSPGFWKLSTGSQDLWTIPMRAGRYLYKNIYFWGLPAFLMLGFLAVRLLPERKNFLYRPHLNIGLLALWVIVFNQVLFFLNPIEIEYLLPMLPFVVLLLGIGFQSHRKLLLILLILIVLANFININLAKPDTPSAASDASFGIWLEPGYTITDIQWRLLLLGCETNECYSSRIPPNSR